MTHVATELEPLGRLQLCPRISVEGAVDGAWWPRSADMGDELPDLIAVFGTLIGPVRRVVYDASMWRSAPSRVIRGATAIPVDSYRLVSRDTIYLSRYPLPGRGALCGAGLRQPVFGASSHARRTRACAHDKRASIAVTAHPADVATRVACD